MPTEYPRPVIDDFLFQAATQAFGAALSNPQAYTHGEHADLRVSVNDLIRMAVMGRYKVGTMYEEADGPARWCHEDGWSIPRNRMLQFTALVRFLASGAADHVLFEGTTINPTHVLRMADAWALRQGLFREDDNPALG